jgi:hypothetical protein
VDAFWTAYNQEDVQAITVALNRLVAAREEQNSDFRIIRDDRKLVAEAQTADLAAETYSKLANFSTHLYLGSKLVGEMASGQKIRVRKPKPPTAH